MEKLKAIFRPAVVGAAVVGASSQAQAALPEGVTSALTEAQTDGVIVAGIVLGVIIAIASFKFIRRAL